MAFVNLSLLIGGVLLAIPIVLHLVMRQQPKQLPFPAVRFIRRRRDTNRRQLQLRHWLLLLLRCLLIAMLALALSRPSVHSLVLGNWMILGVLGFFLVLTALLTIFAVIQRRGRYAVGGLAGGAAILAVAFTVMLWMTAARSGKAVIGDEQAPVAAVLVFDTSPRMQYLHQNRTRLDKAQEIAGWLIRQLPADSEVAVIDSRPGNAVFAVDLAAAQRSIDRLESTAVPRPLISVVDDAVRLSQAGSKPRREVYVFTDLAQRAWLDESPVALQRQLAEASGVLLYVVDVGSSSPQNVALGDLTLSADVLPRSGELQLQTDVQAVGQGRSVAVELYLEDYAPHLPVVEDGEIRLPPTQLRGKQVVDLSSGNQVVRYQLSGFDAGTHHGFLKIAGQDGLNVDDVRHFCVEVQDALPVLVLSPPGTITKFLTDAVAPFEYRETGRAEYDCQVRAQAELPNIDLGDFSAVCLLDPAPLTPPDWGLLTDYVRAGGGLGIFLGHNATETSCNVPEALPVLGGRLVRQWRSTGDLFLAPHNLNHPVTVPFREHASSVPWSNFPVYRHWVLEDYPPHARLVIPYSNNKPAVIETSMGRGRALVMTTPISDPLQLRGRQSWNELPTGEDAWPYFVMVNEMLRYLVDAAGVRLNYMAGETAILVNSRDRYPERYELFSPLDQPQDIVAEDGRLIVKFTEYPGAYRLKGFLGGPISRGFSVNLPVSASDLSRVERKQLDELLGQGRYHYARSTDEIVLGVGEARMGREFYPYLLPLLVLILGLEYVLANRFYRPQADQNVQV